MAYWDTSCLIKLYAAEADSIDFQAHVYGDPAVVTSEIARLELCAALHRKEAAGGLQPGGARRELAAYDADVAAGLIAVNGISPAIVEHFEVIIERCHQQSPPLLLRTLDAIHLATAAVSGESQIVATDKRLRDAALLLGFTVYPTA